MQRADRKLRKLYSLSLSFNELSRIGGGHVEGADRKLRKLYSLSLSFNELSRIGGDMCKGLTGSSGSSTP